MKRKFVVTLLACALLAGQPVWASQGDNHLEVAIKEVKQRIDIPSAFNNFNYSLYGDIYQLSWTEKESGACVNVGCDKDGNILDYYCWKGKNGEETLAKIDYETAEKRASSFIHQVAPEYADQLVKASRKDSSQRHTYFITYNLYHGGIPVYGRQVNVGIDKDTGEVTSYSGISYDEQASYNASVPKIEKEAAASHYLKEIGMSLVYNTYYSDQGTKQAFLSYKTDDEACVGIDALTGKKVARYQEEKPFDGIGGGMGANEAAVSAGDGPTVEKSEQLTEEEQKAVEMAEKFLSPQTLKDRMAKHFPVLNRMTIAGSNLYKYKDHCYYTVTCVYKEGETVIASASFSCDASTGEVNWFNSNSDEEEAIERAKVMTQQQALDLIHQVSPDKAKALRFGEASPDSRPNKKSFEFDRYYQGLKVNGEGITVTWNKHTGSVENYSVNWGNELTFPSVEGTLSQEAILEKIGLKCYYLETGKETYQLAYMLQDQNANYDPYTGHKLDYRGREILDTEGNYYADITGHEHEWLIKKLYDSGIYLEGTMLKPETVMTQKEMIRLITQATAWYSTEEEAYKEAIRQGILGEEEKAPDQALTVMDGIYYLINAAHYKEIASLPDLYQYPFEKGKIEEKMKGYVTLAYGMEMIEGGDTFEQDKPLTRAEAMKMIYNFLQHQ